MGSQFLPFMYVINEALSFDSRVIAVFTVRFLPGWLPGVQFKRTASQWRETLKEWREAPYQFTKSQLVSTSSFVFTGN